MPRIDNVGEIPTKNFILSLSVSKLEGYGHCCEGGDKVPDVKGSKVGIGESKKDEVNGGQSTQDH